MSRMTPVRCIICNAELQEVDESSTNQPYKGTAFTTTGHYGSTTFDPMDGSYLEILICDPCLLKAAETGHVMWGKQARPVIHSDGSVVGWSKTVNRPLVPWDGQSDPDYTVDVIHVDDDDLKNKHLYPEIDWRI